MGMLAIHSNPWVFTFGILGNIISFLVLLAPMPTFIRICKKKSTEGFHSLPYVAALFSAMLWIYYAILKTGAYYLITINAIGCLIETIYIVIYLIYAPRKARILTANLLLVVNLGAFCMIFLLTQWLVKGPKRVEVIGMICVGFAVCVFVAPLSIVKRVIVTKSVEYMPFTLSFFLTLSAVAWFSYGFLLKDFYIALPNILGFIFGVVQMLLYFIYKYCINTPKVKVTEEEQIIDMVFRHKGTREEAMEEGELGEERNNINVTDVTDEEHKGHVDDDDDAESNPNRRDVSEKHMGPANEVKLIVGQLPRFGH